MARPFGVEQCSEMRRNDMGLTIVILAEEDRSWDACVGWVESEVVHHIVCAECIVLGMGSGRPAAQIVVYGCVVGC